MSGDAFRSLVWIDAPKPDPEPYEIRIEGARIRIRDSEGLTLVSGDAPTIAALLVCEPATKPAMATDVIRLIALAHASGYTRGQRAGADEVGDVVRRLLGIDHLCDALADTRR